MGYHFRNSLSFYLSILYFALQSGDGGPVWIASVEDDGVCITTAVRENQMFLNEVHIEC